MVFGFADKSLSPPLFSYFTEVNFGLRVGFNLMAQEKKKLLAASIQIRQNIQYRYIVTPLHLVNDFCDVLGLEKVRKIRRRINEKGIDGSNK